MAESHPSPDYGPGSTDRPLVSDVLVPSLLAGLLVAAAEVAIDVLAAFGTVNYLDAVVGAAFGAVGTAGLVAALLVLALSGPETETVGMGALVAYAAAFVARIPEAIYFGWPIVGPDQVFHPLRPVALFLGVALALRWVLGEDASLVE